MPVLVALSRMYRGEHHPTDIVGSLVFSGLWLTAAALLIRPNEDRPDGPAGGKTGDQAEPAGRISRARAAAAPAPKAERTP
jgi:undecaprenyl-diphosphatase